jgi:hypothetical protein
VYVIASSAEVPFAEREAHRCDFVMSLTRRVAGSNMHSVFARFSIGLAHAFATYANINEHMVLSAFFYRESENESESERRRAIRFWGSFSEQMTVPKLVSGSCRRS